MPSKGDRGFHRKGLRPRTEDRRWSNPICRHESREVPTWYNPSTMKSIPCERYHHQQADLVTAPSRPSPCHKKAKTEAVSPRHLPQAHMGPNHLRVPSLMAGEKPGPISYLKKWAGLARAADPARLFLPQASGGFYHQSSTKLAKPAS